MLRYGAAIGLITCAALALSSWLLLRGGQPQLGMYSQLSAPMILIAGLFLGLRAHFQRGHAIGVPEAVRVGLGIALVAGIITSAFAWMYYTVINPNYMDTLVVLYRERMMEQGFRPEDIEKTLVEMRRSFSIRTQIITTLSQSLTIAVVASAVMGSLFRRPVPPSGP